MTFAALKNMKKQLLALLLVITTAAYPFNAGACRSAIIGKESTADGRVISWWAFQWGWGHRIYVPRADDPVNRDAPLGPLQFTSDNNNVGHLLGKAGNGVNENGLFVSCNINNGMKDGRKALAYFGARAFMSRCSTVAELEQFIDEQTRYVASGGKEGVQHWNVDMAYRYIIGVGDAEGNARLFEVTGDRYRVYVPTAENNYIITRANGCADNPDPTIEGPAGGSKSARTRLKALAPHITLKKIKNQICRMNPDYGNASSMPMHMSALPGEDKRLTLSVNSVGEPYYSVFLPFFGTTANGFNRHLTTAKADPGLSYWSHQMKLAKWGDMSHKWIEFEDHILDFATDELLPCMRGAHGFDADMATRFTNRNAATAYSILRNIARDRTKTLPTCSDIVADISETSVRFSCYSDENSIVWDFGDTSIGKGSTLNHDYTTKGNYLVSATATSKDGIQNTKWHLVTITDER
jgi:hypothetical protein